MLIAALFLTFVPGDAKVTLEAPGLHVAGEPFEVRLSIEAAADGSSLEGWQVTPAAFTVDQKPLAERGTGVALALEAGEKKTVEIDLGPALAATADFELAWGALPPQKVRVLEAAAKGLSFMDEKSVPAGELGKYWVLLRTNRGDLLLELWPDVAPKHVRNFLDLNSTGFYDGIIFHRVFKDFMIQAGNKATKEDPGATTEIDGPRKLKAEFNQKKHERGVLSMARTRDPDSASTQFFIMQKANPGLDGQYSAFGLLVSGYKALDLVASAPGTPIPGAGGVRPSDPQRILRGIVVKAPADPAAWHEGK